jgi:hypothetical protein
MSDVLRLTPNGLHDAYLLRLAVDFEQRVLRLDLNWLVGSPDGETDEEREGFKLGALIIKDLEYCVTEAPAGQGCKGYRDGPSYIDGFETRAIDIERCHLPEVSQDTFRHSIFVGEWNSFIHFAGTSAEVEPAALIEQN